MLPTDLLGAYHPFISKKECSSGKHFNPSVDTAFLGIRKKETTENRGL
jgi:hypothetical protein